MDLIRDRLAVLQEHFVPTPDEKKAMDLAIRVQADLSMFGEASLTREESWLLERWLFSEDT